MFYWLPKSSSGVGQVRQVMATLFCDQGGDESDSISMPGLSTDSDTESDREQPLVTDYFKQHKASIDLPNLKSLKTTCQRLPTVRDSICEDEATSCILDFFLSS